MTLWRGEVLWPYYGPDRHNATEMYLYTSGCQFVIGIWDWYHVSWKYSHRGQAGEFNE